MKIAKFISICIFITFCSCNNKGVYENCISFKLTDFLDKGEIKGTDLQFSKEVMRPTALHSFRIRQLVEVGAGGRGRHPGARRSWGYFSVVEVVVGLFPVLPAGGVDMCTQFTVQEHCLCPFSPGTSQIDGIGRAVAL